MKGIGASRAGQLKHLVAGLVGSAIEAFNLGKAVLGRSTKQRGSRGYESRSKYVPHQGDREMARRRIQIAKGIVHVGEEP